MLCVFILIIYPFRLTKTRAVRALGSQMGLTFAIALLWWYWPEAHGYILEPVALTMLGIIFFCDMLYPLLIAYVRMTEVILEDGTIVAPWSPEAKQKKAQ